MYRFASRLDGMGGAGAFNAINKARDMERQGRAVIHLEVGEPDFDTPEHVKTRLKQALDDNQTHYAPSQGLPALREAVARSVSRTRGVAVSPDDVAVAPGCKQMIFMILSTLIQEGDEVIVQAPGYPAYEAVVQYLGGTVVDLPLKEEKNFRFDPADLASRVTDRTRLLILNSPQNPTGGTLTADDCKAVAELAHQKDFLVLSDEIYSRILYEGTYHSVLSQPGMVDRTILVDGFSKSYAMTGWRLGYAVMPAPVCRQVVRLLVNSVSCVTTFVQWAGIAALEGPQDEVERMVDQFRRRRDLLVQGLNTLPGVRCQWPTGAFYAFPNVSALGHSSQDLADYLLQEAGVACLSGSAFGSRGEGYLRLSYANSLENLQKAIDAMRAALQRLPAPARRP